MGTIQYSDERDKTLFSNASLAIGKLITGSNNQQGLDALKKIFLKHVESVIFTPFNDPNVNPNIILHEKSYKRSVCSKYDDYIPLAKLMITVFSNWDRADYNKIIENYNTIGICSLNIKTDTNKDIKANDLLYGYMYNPIYTLQQYESIMGDNSYISLITQFDRIKQNGVIDKKNVESILRSLSKYATYKISKLVKNNTLSNEEGMRILNNIRSNDEKYKTILWDF